MREWKNNGIRSLVDWKHKFQHLKILRVVQNAFKRFIYNQRCLIENNIRENLKLSHQDIQRLFFICSKSFDRYPKNLSINVILHFAPSHTEFCFIVNLSAQLCTNLRSVNRRPKLKYLCLFCWNLICKIWFHVIT